MSLESTLEDVRIERLRQLQKYPQPEVQSDGVWLALIGEEFGEVARALLERRGEGLGQARKELIQLAAGAVAWVEALDSRHVCESCEGFPGSVIEHSQGGLTCMGGWPTLWDGGEGDGEQNIYADEEYASSVHTCHAECPCHTGGEPTPDWPG